MVYHDISAEEFDKITAGGRKVLVDFWASWCKPCLAQGGIIEELVSSGADVDVIKLDVDKDENAPLCARYNVMSIPTLVFFKDGTQCAVKVGVTSIAGMLKCFE